MDELPTLSTVDVTATRPLLMRMANETSLSSASRGAGLIPKDQENASRRRLVMLVGLVLQ
jgi:hypothetical protein